METVNPGKLKVSRLAIASLLISLAPIVLYLCCMHFPTTCFPICLVLFMLLLPLAAIVSSAIFIIVLVKPEIKGKGFAIASLIIGLIDWTWSSWMITEITKGSPI